jgi:hypothetical protein
MSRFKLQAIVSTSDLCVKVLFDNVAFASADQAALTGAPLLRHEVMTDGVMVAFMVRLSGSDQFSSVAFTQSAHHSASPWAAALI